jgi:hypothetical protein
MNWWFGLITVLLLIVITIINQKAKKYIIMQMVRNNILKQAGASEEVVIYGYNLVYSFIIVPIVLMSFSLFTNTPFEYNIVYSVLMFISSFILL